MEVRKGELLFYEQGAPAGYLKTMAFPNFARDSEVYVIVQKGETAYMDIL